MEKMLVSGAPDAQRVVSRTSLSSAELEEQDKQVADAMQKTKRSEVDSCTDEETDFEMQTRKSRRRAQLSVVGYGFRYLRRERRKTYAHGISRAKVRRLH